MRILSSSAFQRPETHSSSSSLRSHNSGFHAPRMRAALSTLASDGISHMEVGGPEVGKGHEENETEIVVSLGELIDRHIAAQLATMDAVRTWDERRATGEVTNVTYANRLLGVARDEEAGWMAIVDCRPRSDRESRLKLTYMAAYLMATRGTLTADELRSALEAPRDRPNASIS
uniref:RptA n=1 Tax=Rhizobium meliloti TaxID=382 RepID=I6QLD4_RHIML|nr:RptA [Sinorhizobium meliloti]